MPDQNPVKNPGITNEAVTASTPMDDPPVPRVGIHGNLLKTIVSGSYLRRVPEWEGAVIVLALTVLMARRLPLPAALHNQAWLMRLYDGRKGIPYGVALTAGALYLLPHAEIFGVVGRA